MNSWPEILRSPTNRRDDAQRRAWFDRIAQALLNGASLVVGGLAHRLVEIEVYYRSPEHPDPFAHAQAIQHECGRWYFHKTGTGYRGGSYKGFDLTFGDGVVHAGILIRGIELPSGSLISGPGIV